MSPPGVSIFLRNIDEKTGASSYKQKKRIPRGYMPHFKDSLNTYTFPTAKLGIFYARLIFV